MSSNLTVSEFENYDVSRFSHDELVSFIDGFASTHHLVTELDLSHWDVSHLTDLSGLFRPFGKTFISQLNLNNWNTSNVTDMRDMFHGCYMVERIYGLKDLNTSNVICMCRMFMNCNSLVSLDVSNWDVSKVVDMGSMFSDCYKLAIIRGINRWNASSVSNLMWMFSDCWALKTIDLSNWRPSRIIGDRMFYQCHELRTVNLKGWRVLHELLLASECNKLVRIITDPVNGDERGRMITEFQTYTHTIEGGVVGDERAMSVEHESNDEEQTDEQANEVHVFHHSENNQQIRFPDWRLAYGEDFRTNNTDRNNNEEGFRLWNY